MTDFNGVMMQYFHWYTAEGDNLWHQLAENAEALAKAGVTSVWLPPAYKGAAGSNDVGYGVYDLFDLGEFDQKGAVRTKYGTREEYLAAIQCVQKAGLQVYADAVFNHKMGGDGTEEFNATPFNPQNRYEPAGGLAQIKAWTSFTFPGRNKKYSAFEWHWQHFKAVNYNANDPDKAAVYLFEGKQFDADVDHENGNFDYLMGCDLDVDNQDVKNELFAWGKWYLETTGVDGFRFDAVKHINAGFFIEWLNYMHSISKRKLFFVGEYWSTKSDSLKHFIDATQGQMMLFDAGLHFNFAHASTQGKGYDMRQVFDNTLIRDYPSLAVTLVSNHDTQPLQAMESVVDPWFKPLAYAIILLRRDGYPCIFAADYYGAQYRDRGHDGGEYDIVMPSHQWILDVFLDARRRYAYGDQYEYFDHANCVGWTRTGDAQHPGGIAVILSNSDAGHKSMQTASPDTAYIDVTKHIGEPVLTNGDGWGEFRCDAGSVSVWVPQ